MGLDLTKKVGAKNPDLFGVKSISLFTEDLFSEVLT